MTKMRICCPPRALRLYQYSDHPATGGLMEAIRT
jgi:hypothetical protein